MWGNYKESIVSSESKAPIAFVTLVGRSSRIFTAPHFVVLSAAAIAYTLIETCRMNNVDPKAWMR